MKRKRNLLTKKNLTLDVCRMAILNASKRKKKRYYVKNILNNLDSYSIKLRNMILNNTYVPTPYKYKITTEYGKLRNLAKPKFWPDQCVHHVLYIVAKDVFNNHIDPHAISSISNRGIDMGVKLLKNWLHKDTPHARAQIKYCVKFDIKKCYESVSPKIVLESVKRVIKDEKYLSILKNILSLHPSLPLGNFLSSWLLNLLMRDVDNCARTYRDSKGNRVCTHYLRYMDDIVIFGKSKRKLWGLFYKIKDILSSIGLTVKRKSFAFFPTAKRAVDMLGFKFSQTGVGWRKKNLKMFKRECIRFSNGKYFTAKRARGLLSRLSQLNKFSSKKVWEFAMKHINIEKVKDIAYPGYQKRQILKRESKKNRLKQIRIKKHEEYKKRKAISFLNARLKHLENDKVYYSSNINNLDSIHMYQAQLENLCAMKGNDNNV